MDKDKDKGGKQETQSTKFGKLLAVGMAIALIWGFLLLIVGVYIRLKLGTMISGALGNVETKVKVADVKSETNQEIAKYSQTVDDDIELGDWQNTLAGFIVGIAVITIIFSVLGIYGGLKHSRLILYITVAFLLIAALIIIGLLSITVDVDAGFHKDTRAELATKVKNDFKAEAGDDAFTMAMNAVMLWFECCGIIGPEDFVNLTYYEVDKAGKRTKIDFKVAPACCNAAAFKGTSLITPYDSVKDCAKKGTDSSFANLQGCYKQLYDVFATPATAILVLILVWDVLVLLLTILTIMEAGHVEEAKETAAKEELQKEALEEVPEVKKFVPFARISSFIHPDVNRIKSTEIW